MYFPLNLVQFSTVMASELAQKNYFIAEKLSIAFIAEKLSSRSRYLKTNKKLAAPLLQLFPGGLCFSCKLQVTSH